MNRTIDALTAERLRELLRYEPHTGLFYWRVNRGSVRAGAQAGTITTARSGVLLRRYRLINVLGVKWKAHRLAFLWMTGSWPSAGVDHEDGDGLNNRWRNLREANQSQNTANARCRANNATGLKGVFFRRDRQRYQSKITVHGRQIYLGCFEAAEDAHAAYVAAAEKHFGEFARAA